MTHDTAPAKLLRRKFQGLSSRAKAEHRHARRCRGPDDPASSGQSEDPKYPPNRSIAWLPGLAREMLFRTYNARSLTKNPFTKYARMIIVHLAFTYFHYLLTLARDVRYLEQVLRQK